MDSVVREKQYLLTVKTPTLEDTEKFIRHNIINNYAQYVAVHEGEIIGWADILPHQKELIKHVGLLGMGVVAKYRGNGIGKELLVKTIGHSKNIGLKRLELEVYSYNSVAIGLYEKLGFEYEGTKRRARYINNNYEDVNTMSLCFI